MSKKKEEKPNINIDACVEETILEMPISFSLDGHYFYIFPPSVGIVFLTQPLMRELHLNKDLFIIREEFEYVRIAIEQREKLLRLVAIHSFGNRHDAIYEDKVLQRMSELEPIEAADLAAIFSTLLRWMTYQEQFIKHFCIDTERKQKEKISEFKKKDSSSVTFGGRSIFGSLLDMACERYKWRLDYLLWEISATTLNMMLADSITTMYLSKDDAKKCGVSTDGIVIKMDDPRNKEKIKQLVRQLKKK